MDDMIRRALEADIQMTHDRFVQAMETRLPTLEDDAKPLNQVMNEMMAEAAGLLMAEMQFRQKG